MVKKFKATDPITGITFMRAYSRATSDNARRFLQHLIEQAPFEIHSAGGWAVNLEMTLNRFVNNVASFCSYCPLKSPRSIVVTMAVTSAPMA